MGEFYALLTAVIWAAAMILLKRSGETIPPFALNFFRVVVSAACLVLTLLLQGQAIFYQAPVKDYLTLFGSGVIAIAISDTLFHAALNRVGAGIMAIIDCLYSPAVVLCAFIMLRETLEPMQWVGMALVIVGVLIAARHEPPHGTSPKQILIGSVYGIFSMATLAVGIVMAKPVLERSPVLWATTMRQLGALVVMIPFVLIAPNRREILGLYRPSRNWKFSMPGTILGSYLALILWIAGMKYSNAGPAAILNQTSSIYVLIFASIFLKEPFTLRKIAASVLAIAGIVLVTLA